MYEGAKELSFITATSLRVKEPKETHANAGEELRTRHFWLCLGSGAFPIETVWL